MKSRPFLVLLIAVSLLAVAAPAEASPDKEPWQQDFATGDGTGWESCWECVPSVSQGYVCRPENIGYKGCQRAVTYTTDSDGNTHTEISCSVVPYGFCVTITP